MSDRDDLLRVDSTGTVHPVGRTASQWLRSKAGDWRLAATPPELLVARRVASQRSSQPSSVRDGSTAPESRCREEFESDAPLRLAGEIGTPGALSDIVMMIANARWRGELVVVSDEGERSFYVDAGAVTRAATSVNSEHVGEMLVRSGALSRSTLESLLNERDASSSIKRFGEKAVAHHVVEPEVLYAVMGRQLEEVFFAALRLREGFFCFFDRPEDKGVLPRHAYGVEALVIEAARRTDEMRYFREKIPSSDYVPVRVEGHDVPAELRAIFDACDGYRSVATIGTCIGQIEIDVMRAIFQLMQLDCIRLAAPRVHGPEAIVVTFNAALAELHRACDAHDRGDPLRESLERFATGAGVYAPLFMGAGPLADGTLRPHRMAQNVASLTGETPERCDRWLTEMLNQYVGFALFQAESLLGRHVHAELVVRVVDLLEPIKPLSDTSPHYRGSP